MSGAGSVPETSRAQPIVSVDTVPMRLDPEGRLRISLVRRPWEPFEGAWALPGVMLLGNERLSEAAVRALTSKAGVAPEDVLTLRQCGAFDDLARDPRGPTVALAQLAILPPSAAPAAGATTVLDAPADRLPPLAFDHQRIVDAALVRLSEILLSDAAASRSLLGAEFATTRANQAYAALEAAGAPGASPSGMSRRLAATAHLVKTERTQAFGRGKPAPIWAWHLPEEN